MKAITGRVIKKKGRWGGMQTDIKFTLDKTKEYIYVEFMTCDGHAYLHSLLEYDPHNEKQVKFVEEFIKYYENDWYQYNYNKRISWYNGKRWQTVDNVERIENTGSYRFTDVSTYNSRCNLQSVDYLLKYYVGNTSIFFYHSQWSSWTEPRDKYDESYEEWRSIKEDYAGKKFPVPKYLQKHG